VVYDKQAKEVYIHGGSGGEGKGLGGEEKENREVRARGKEGDGTDDAWNDGWMHWTGYREEQSRHGLREA
jgi:hypothetical protein